jgi:hypothetical protein
MRRVHIGRVYPPLEQSGRVQMQRTSPHTRTPYTPRTPFNRVLT